MWAEKPLRRLAALLLSHTHSPSLSLARAQCLGAIGEVLDEGGDVISGVAVNLRKREDRVAIWTRTCDEAKVGDI